MLAPVAAAGSPAYIPPASAVLAMAAVSVIWVGLGALTWWDLWMLPDERIRGPKNLWRVLSAVNAGGSVLYWLIGRRWIWPGGRRTHRAAIADGQGQGQP